MNYGEQNRVSGIWFESHILHSNTYMHKNPQTSAYVHTHTRAHLGKHTRQATHTHVPYSPIDPPSMSPLIPLFLLPRFLPHFLHIPFV